jgi:hypothetical protein
MPEQQITLLIDEEGCITAKTNGFKGETCLEALDNLLGEKLNVAQVKTTDEFDQKMITSKNIIKVKGY